MGTGGNPAAQAQLPNAGGFSMDSFMQQLLPQLFGNQGSSQPAGFGSVAIPQIPPASVPNAPSPQVPNLMAGFGQTNQQLAQQHAMPFPPPPIRPTPVTALPNSSGSATAPKTGTKAWRDQIIQDRKDNPKTNAVTRARERRG